MIGVPPAAAWVSALRRPDQRPGVGLDGVDAGVGTTAGDGEGERARAGAQVDDQRRRDVGDLLQAPLEEDLGLGARDEHAGPDGDLGGAEDGGAEDVLQRFPGGAPRDEGLQRLDDVGVDERDGREPAAVDAEDVHRQPFGVGAGTRDAGVGEGPLGLHEGDPQRQPLHDPPSPIATASTRSAATSAAMTSPRSPSRTADRLCAL